MWPMKSRSQPVRVPMDLETLQAYWQLLNATYFDNRLPPIEICWSTRLTASTGLFVGQAEPSNSGTTRTFRAGGNRQVRPIRQIRLSLPLLQGQPLEEIRNTLAHEMIHQWQFDIQKHRPTHGPEFRQFMARMNQDGLHITVYHTLTQAVEALTRYTWQCASCGHAYHRQRKTLSPKRHRCGVCLGPLREVRLDRPATEAQHILRKSAQRGAPVQLTFNFLRKAGSKHAYSPVSRSRDK
ncbi:MAG: M48 family peptidase [Nitrospirae bacterium]|nr:MAG: M48 family peptidase [Nitrospirota bacterium]